MRDFTSDGFLPYKESFVFEVTYDDKTLKPHPCHALWPVEEKDKHPIAGMSTNQTQFPPRGTELGTLFTSPDGVTDWEKTLYDLIACFYNYDKEGNSISCKNMGCTIKLTKDQQTWVFHEVWPRSLSFGYLSYSTDPSVDVEIIWCYESVDLQK